MPALQATLHISNAWWSKIVFLLFSEESFDLYWEGEEDKKRRPNLFDDDDDDSSFGWIDSKEVADLMKQSRRLASNDDDDDDDEELGEAWGGVEYSLNQGMMSQK